MRPLEQASRLGGRHGTYGPRGVAMGARARAGAVVRVAAAAADTEPAAGGAAAEAERRGLLERAGRCPPWQAWWGAGVARWALRSKTGKGPHGMAQATAKPKQGSGLILRSGSAACSPTDPPRALPRAAPAAAGPAPAAGGINGPARPGAAAAAAGGKGEKKSNNMLLSEGLLNVSIALVGDDTALNWAVCQARSGARGATRGPRGRERPLPASRGMSARPSRARARPPLEALSARGPRRLFLPPRPPLSAPLPPGAVQAHRLVPRVHRARAVRHAQGRERGGAGRPRRVRRGR
jgi:hypothetical protein